jgi:Protein  of unknown function (DUF3018)
MTKAAITLLMQSSYFFRYAIFSISCLTHCTVHRCPQFCNALQSSGTCEEIKMPAPDERMRMMRERRRRQGLRELRLNVPDPRLRSVRKRVAAQVARLNRRNEDEALDWIEEVSEFDATNPNEP